MSSIRDTNVWDIILWLLGRRQRFRVEGLSMLPLLQPGDEVLVNRQAYRHSRPSVGNVVIVQHPQQLNLCLIKRVIAINENGDCFVQGDNSNYSTDSRVFGWVKPELILGLVTCKFLGTGKQK